MSNGDRSAFIPTPEDIEAEAARIRSRWDESEMETRRTGLSPSQREIASQWTPPVVASRVLLGEPEQGE